MTKVDVRVKRLRDGTVLETVTYIPAPRPKVTRKYLLELVHGWVNSHGRTGMAQYVKAPYLSKDQVEGAPFCPRLLIYVIEAGVGTYYVAMGMTCKEAQELVRAGKTLKVMETKHGKEIVAV